MTKRQEKKQIRMEEEKAVAMYLAGKTLNQIKKTTSVDGYIVRGLVCAYTLSRI